jgi:hypothetical protein
MAWRLPLIAKADETLNRQHHAIEQKADDADCEHGDQNSR